MIRKVLLIAIILFFTCCITNAQMAKWRYADNHPYKRGLVLPQSPTPYLQPINPRVPNLYNPYHYPPTYRLKPYWDYRYSPLYQQPVFAYGIYGNGVSSGFYWNYRIR